MTGAIRTENESTILPTGVAVVGAAGAGAIVAGVPGLLAGAVLVVAWLLVSPIFVVALGQVLFAAVLPADASLAAMALVEAPLVALLLVDVTDRRAPLRTLALGVASLVAVGGLTVAGIAWLGRLWEAAALLACVVALASYGLHRYTVVTLEITDEF